MHRRQLTPVAGRLSAMQWGATLSKHSPRVATRVMARTFE
jgi:hypothetical protein